MDTKRVQAHNAQHNESYPVNGQETAQSDASQWHCSQGTSVNLCAGKYAKCAIRMYR